MSRMILFELCYLKKKKKNTSHHFSRACLSYTFDGSLTLLNFNDDCFSYQFSSIHFHQCPSIRQKIATHFLPVGLLLQFRFVHQKLECHNYKRLVCDDFKFKTFQLSIYNDFDVPKKHRTRSEKNVQFYNAQKTIENVLFNLFCTFFQINILKYSFEL